MCMKRSEGLWAVSDRTNNIEFQKNYNLFFLSVEQPDFETTKCLNLRTIMFFATLF